jgi:2-polyprenyl-6-methoxyphenol hydroxylase-like FAD-dependent oxidoreductase
MAEEATHAGAQPGAHVVVVGAGPGGATLAYLLARRGARVTLLERQSDFEREFRGEALMQNGVDALRQMGLGAHLDALPSFQVRRVEIFRNARPLLTLDPEEALGVPGPRLVPQPALLEMLCARGAEQPRFSLQRGAIVRDLVRDDAGRVSGVRVEGAGGAREIAADLVVGADGRGSVLRRRAGLHEERAAQAFDVVWCKVPLPDFLRERGAARAYLGERHFSLAFPTYGDRLQMAWIIDKGSFGELRRRGIEAWVDEMAGFVSPDLGAHLRARRAEISHPFLLDVICDLVPRWTAPGVALLGDAAHPMSPVGAQGINVALRDALVFANHLVPALAAGARGAALDAAAAAAATERTPEVRAVQRLQQIPPRLLFGRGLGNRALVAAAGLLARLGVLQRVAGAAARRFARGVDPVQLRV